MVRRSLQRCLPLFALLPFLAACANFRHTTSVTPTSPVAEQTTQAPEPESAPVALQDPVSPLSAQSDAQVRKTPIAADLAAPITDEPTESPSEPATIDELLALSETITPAPELREAVRLDLQAAPPDIPIPLNQKVLSYIALFQGRLHDFIQEGMTRGARYLPMIQQVFRAEGLPLDLAYVPLVESAFKPNALSRARARGVWQFVRSTGIENGLKQDWFVDERSDPEKATAAAAKYLAMLSTMFNGDWHLALASYNGGPGRVQRAMTRGKQTDFWKLAAKPALLPRETREYVPMILAAIIVARNPEQYGFAFGPFEPLSYDTVTLHVPVDLRKIAEWTSTTVDEIQSLNPELRRWTTPVRDADYAIKVPKGTTEAVTARLTGSEGAELASIRYYAVKRGDTVTTIANKLRVTRSDLAEANYLKTTARLSVGQELIIPQDATVLAARADRPEPVAAARAADARDTVVPAVINTTNEADFLRTSYRIRSGDTLTSIARNFRTTVAQLQRWNGITGSQIRAGDRLTIYTVRAN